MKKNCSAVFHICYKDIEYWYLINLAKSNLIIHLRLLSLLYDICPQMSLWFTHWCNHFCSKQSVISFVWGAVYFCPADFSLEAKPGRGDVMMAIAYNAPASCRCTDPLSPEVWPQPWVYRGNICLMIWSAGCRFDLIWHKTLHWRDLSYMIWRSIFVIRPHLAVIAVLK